MSTNTTNYNLIKPDDADEANISDINTNMDTIDIAITNLMNSKEDALKRATEKSSLADADTMPLIDSADNSKTKTISFNNIKAALKTYFDTLYNNIVISNNLATTEEGSALDAVQGKRLADDISTINTSLSTEVTNRTIAVNNEATARANADNILNTEINKVKAGGLDGMTVEKYVMSSMF